MPASRTFFSGRLQRTTRGERCYWDTCGVPLWPPVDGLVCVLCTQRKDRASDQDHTLDCARCGKVVRISEMSDTHHEGLCARCWDSTGCEDCIPGHGRVRPATTRRDGKYVCSPCSIKRLFKCEDCGTLDAGTERVLGNKIHWICSPCFTKPKVSRFRADTPAFVPAICADCEYVRSACTCCASAPVAAAPVAAAPVAAAPVASAPGVARWRARAAELK